MILIKENSLLTGKMANCFHNNQVKISQSLLEEKESFFHPVLKKRLRNAIKEYVLLFVMTLI